MNFELRLIIFAKCQNSEFFVYLFKFHVRSKLIRIDSANIPRRIKLITCFRPCMRLDLVVTSAERKQRLIMVAVM